VNQEALEVSDVKPTRAPFRVVLTVTFPDRKHFVETLECGHQEAARRIYIPQAKKRRCQECQAVAEGLFK
jgi:hypothetical protein